MLNHDKIGERRKPRVPFGTRITMTVGESRIQVSGSSKDLSLKGVFVNTDKAPEVGSKCSLAIELTGTIEAFVLEIQGHVARHGDGGVAVIFDAMEVDTYTHLKNVVRYNYENPDEV